MFRSNFQDSSVRAFCNQCISVWQSLCGADIGAVKLGSIGKQQKSRFQRRILPGNLQCDRIELQHTGIISSGMIHTGYRTGIWISVTAFPAVVKHQQVSFSRKTFWYHVQMVLPDNPAQFSGCFAFVKIRSQSPDNLSCRLADNSKNIGISGIKNNIVRMKAFISRVVPFIFSQR